MPFLRPVQAGTHPDYQLIAPEEQGKQIKVDQIRDLIGQFSLASHQGGYRVAIISPAENMNISAANSLLKTLEEPPSDTLLILVCERPSALPLTVLSRCQVVKFTPPEQTVSLEWLNNAHFIERDHALALLAIAGNAPLAALEYSQGDQLALRDELFSSIRRITGEGEPALQAVKPWLKLELPGPINWLYSWISDLIRIKLEPRAEIINRDLSKELQQLARHVDLEDLFRFQDELTVMLRSQRAPFNLQLLYENVLLGWEKISTPAGRG